MKVYIVFPFLALSLMAGCVEPMPPAEPRQASLNYTASCHFAFRSPEQNFSGRCNLAFTNQALKLEVSSPFHLRMLSIYADSEKLVVIDYAHHQVFDKPPTLENWQELTGLPFTSQDIKAILLYDLRQARSKVKSYSANTKMVWEFVGTGQAQPAKVIFEDIASRNGEELAQKFRLYLSGGLEWQFGLQNLERPASLTIQPPEL